MEIKIGIVGSRRRDSEEDFDIVKRKFLQLRIHLGFKYNTSSSDFITSFDPFNIIIVSGGCKKGGDRFAEIIAKSNDFPIIIHYPDESKIDKELQKINYRAAYAQIAYARNELIARDSDYLIACVHNSRTGGTENTIKHFLKTFKKPEENLILC